MKNKLPKIICLLLAITLSFCVTGCNKKGSTKAKKIRFKIKFKRLGFGLQ